MKKELIIFLLILSIFSLLAHLNEFTTNPIEHIKSLPQSSVYGLGFFHPFIITSIIYLLLWLPRYIIKSLNKKSQ